MKGFSDRNPLYKQSNCILVILKTFCFNLVIAIDLPVHWIYFTLSGSLFQADKVDGYLHQVQIKHDASRQYGSSFGTWVLYYSLQVMISYIQAGFELELYAPYEYHYIYW